MVHWAHWARISTKKKLKKKVPEKKRKRAKKKMEKTGIVIGDVHHTSQKACAEHVRTLLRSIGVTERMGRSGRSADVRYFYELCQRHPRAEDKLRNFADFAVRRDLLNTSAMALYIVNTDWSTTEISWRKCVTRKAETALSMFRAALRNSVKEQVLDFRAAQTNAACPTCNRPIAPTERPVPESLRFPRKQVDSFHVDHVVHFAKLVEDFMDENKGTIVAPVQYDKEPRTLLTIFTESDAAIASKFREYHLHHAQLRALCVACNLARPNHNCG
jgi:hypothetical protein